MQQQEALVMPVRGQPVGAARIVMRDHDGRRAIRVGHHGALVDAGRDIPVIERSHPPVVDLIFQNSQSGIGVSINSASPGPNVQ